MSASKSIDNLCLLVLAEVTICQYDCFKVGLALQGRYKQVDRFLAHLAEPSAVHKLLLVTLLHDDLFAAAEVDMHE